MKMIDSNENINVAEEKESLWNTLAETELNYTPLVDIYENENEYVLIANTPGIDKENIHVKLEDNTLIILGKSNQKEKDDKKFILKEVGYPNYYREFKISDGIDGAKISSSYENGQLTVILPKHDKIKPKTINIK
jgi:HSP20 family protein